MGKLTRSDMDDVTAYASDWLEFQRKVQNKVGIQVAVYFDDGIIYSDALGFADVEAQEALRSDHLMRIASHSKWYTATAVAQLVEDEKLRLEDRIGDHLDWINDQFKYGDKAELTVQELLTHGSGLIRNGLDADVFQLLAAAVTKDEFPASLEGHTSLLPPSTRFKYSNIGYTLLGEVIEAAADVPFDQFIQTQVLDRLSLSSTGTDFRPGLEARFARGYTALEFESQDRRPVDHYSLGALVPAGGFYSTAEEVCKFAAAHFFGDGRLITDESKRAMQTPQWNTGQSENSEYGLGLMISKVGERKLFGHSGGLFGYISYSVFDPQDRLAISILTNTTDRGALGMVESLVKLLNIAADHPDGQPEPGPQEKNGRSRFTGRFSSGWGTRDVVQLGDHLVSIDPAQPDPMPALEELTPINETQCVAETKDGYGGPAESLDFKFNGNGTIEQVRIAGITHFTPSRYRERFTEKGMITLPATHSQ